METATEQDQTVKSEEVVEEVKAGEVKEDTVETAATEKEGGLIEGEPKGLSIDDIVSDGEAEVSPELVGEDEKILTPESQAKINKKINAAIGGQKAAENRASIAEKKVQELESIKQAPTERPQVPVREDYETAEEYRKDYAKYEDETVTYNQSQTAISDQATRANKQKSGDIERFESQAVRLREKYPDFDKLVMSNNADGTNPFGDKSNLILNAEYNAPIALYLRNNPAVLDEIKSLDRSSALLRIGELNGQFKTKQKKTTAAPKALNTIKGATDTTPTKSIYEIKDNSEFLKERNKEILRKRSGAK